MEETTQETYDELDDILTEIDGIMYGDKFDMHDKFCKVQDLMMRAVSAIDDYKLERFHWENKQIFA